jgi:Ribbon-helix-helix protein, copG family
LTSAGSDAIVLQMRITASLTDRQLKAINKEAARLGVSAAEVIRRWLDEHIDKGASK